MKLRDVDVDVDVKIVEREVAVIGLNEHKLRMIEAVQAAIERCARMLDESAAGLFGGKKRINQVDTHVAYVLREHAAKMRKIREGA